MKSSRDAYNRAEIAHKRAKKLYVLVQANNGRAEFAEEQLQAMVPCGLWEHWKSRADKPRLTVVSKVQFDSSNGSAPNVSLVDLYFPDAGKSRFRNLIGRDGFLDPVHRARFEGRPYTGPRFVLVRPLNPILAVLLEQAARRLAKSERSRGELIDDIDQYLSGLPVS